MKPFSLAFIYNSDTRVSAFDVIYYEGEKLFFVREKERELAKIANCKIEF